MTKFESAQAPKNQSPNHAPQLEAHPERVPTTLGGTTPANEDWEPQKINQEPKNRNKLATGIVIGSISTLAAAALGGWLYARGASNDFRTTMTGGDKGNTAEPFSGTDIDRNPGQLEVAPTLDNATPEQFYDDKYFSDEQRVDWAYNKLSQPSQEAGHENTTILQAEYKKLAAKYNTPDHKYIQDYTEPSEGMNGDSILSLQTAIHTIAAESDLSDFDRAKILAAALDNSDPIRNEAMTSAINRDIKHLNGIYAVRETPEGSKMESPVFRNYIPENGYNPAGTPSIVLSTLNVANDSQERFQEIYQFVDQKPVRVDFYSTSDASKRITYPENIPYEPAA